MTLGYYFDRERREGKEERLIEQVCKKLRKRKEVCQIADELEEDESHISVICKVAGKYAPDYNVEKIMEELEQMAPA